MANRNADIDLIATLDESSSEEEILKAIKILNGRLKGNGNAKIKLDAILDVKSIRKELTRLETLLKSKANNSVKVNINGEIDKNSTISSLHKATKRAQSVANNNAIQIDMNLKKDKLINDIKIFGQQNTKLFKDANMTAKYNSLLDNAKLATSAKQIQDLRMQLSAMRSEIKATNLSGLTLGDTFKKTFKRATELFTGTGGVMLLSQQLRKAWTEALELDSAYTDLIKVQNELTRGDYPEYLERCNKKAQELATTQKPLIESTTEFSKSGYSLTDSNALADQATILANVGDMSASDSAKAIISGVQAYDIIDGYDDVEKKAEALIDKYNEIGNTASITTAEIAEGVQTVGSVFADANTSVDEFIALLAAGNRQYQDADALALALRTSALRIRGCTAELEAMGEETDDVITSTSKLEAKIKALTNVNGSGGVEILEADGETFRSIYDIFVDISKVYDDMADTDQSALTELISGKHRYSAISATLNNMSEAQKIYQRSLESTGSAQEEYDKYLQSSEAALNRFKSSMTETYQSVINGETVTGILNCGNATLQFANSIGLVESSLKGLLAIGIVKAITTLSTAFKASAIQASNFGTALNTVKNMSTMAKGTTEYANALKALKTVSAGLSETQLKQVLASKALSDSDRIAILRTTGLTKAQAQAKLAQMGLTQSTKAQTTANASATASTFSLTAAVKRFGVSLKSAFLSNPIGITIMGISMAFGAVYSAIDKVKQKEEEARQTAIELTNTYKQEKESLDSQIESYKELKESLDNGNLSTDETRSIKEQLLEIQQSLIDSYGDEASNIDLVNGKYKEQLGLLSELSKEKASDYVKENRAAFEKAKEELEKTRTYKIGSIFSYNSESGMSGEQKQLYDYIKSYSDLFEIKRLYDTSTLSNSDYAPTLFVNANADEAKAIIDQFYDDVEKYIKDNNLQLDYDSLQIDLSKVSSDIETDDALKEYREIYDEFMKAEIVRNDTLRPLYQQSIQAVEDYNKALSSGEGVEEAKANLDSVQQSVQNATGELEGSQEVFDGIYDGINKNAEAAYNLSQAFENDKTVQRYAEQLRGLTDVDLKAINFEDNVEQPGEKAFTSLMDYLGYTEEKVQSLIDKLVELGYVQGEISTQSPSPINFDSASFLESVSYIQSGYEKLLSAQEEFNEYGAITASTLKDLMDNDLIQYLQFTADGLSINTKALEDNEQALKDTATAELYNAMCNDIQNLSLGDTASLSDIAQTAIANLDSAATTAGENAAIAAQGWWEYGASIQSIPGVSDLTGDNYKKALAIVDQYKNLANSINAISIENTNSTKKSSSSSSSTTDTWKEAFQAEYDTLKHNLEMEYIKEEQYYNSLNALNQKYFSGKSEYLDEYRKYEEEVYKGLKSIYKDYVDSYLSYMKQSLESSRIDYKTYSRDVTKFLKDMFDQGKIAAKDYFDYTQEMLEVQKDAMDGVISAVVNRLDKEIDSYEDQIDEVEKRYQTEIDYLDTVIKYYEDQKKALQDSNDELDRQKALEEALYNLERAQNQRTKALYTADKGKIYTTNTSAIRDAEEEVRKSKLDIEIAKLDDAIEKVELQQDSLKDAMDREKEQLQEVIDRLEDYKDQWNSVAKIHEEAENEMYANGILGLGWQTEILNGNQNILNNFKDNYISIQQAIADAAWESTKSQIAASKEAGQGIADITGIGNALDEATNSLRDYNAEAENISQEPYNSIIGGAQDASNAIGGDGQGGYDISYDDMKAETVSRQKSAKNTSSSGGGSLIGSVNSLETAEGSAQQSSKALMDEISNGAGVAKGQVDGIKSSVEELDGAHAEVTIDIKVNGSVPNLSGLSGGGKGSSVNTMQAYGTGTNDAEPGVHTVAENGTEIIRTNDGNAYVAEGEQLHYFEGGETVIKASESAKILANMDNLIPLQDYVNKLSPIDYSSMVMSNLNIPDFSKLAVNRGESTTISIGDIHLHEVQNVDTLAKQIVRDMGNKVRQETSKHKW